MANSSTALNASPDKTSDELVSDSIRIAGHKLRARHLIYFLVVIFIILIIIFALVVATYVKETNENNATSGASGTTPTNIKTTATTPSTMMASTTWATTKQASISAASTTKTNFATTVTINTTKSFFNSTTTTLINTVSLMNSTSIITSTASTTTAATQTGPEIAAAYLRQQINESANPCVNFYEFACGGWIQNNPVPPEYSEWSISAALEAQSIQVVAEMLNNLDPNNHTMLEPIRQTKLAYDSCINYDPVDQNSYNKHLIDLIQGEFGGWPIINPVWNASEVRLDPMSYTALLQSAQGVVTILNSYVDVDWKNSAQHILYIDQGALGLGKPDFYLNQTKYQTQIAAYRNMIIQTARTLSQDIGNSDSISTAQISTDADEIIDFETKVAMEIMPARQNLGENFTELYNAMTLKELKEQWPSLFWDEFFVHLLPSQFVQSSSDHSKSFNRLYALDNDSTVVVMYPEYITKLVEILNATNPRTLSNYFVWRLVESLVPLMDNRTKSVFQNFHKKSKFISELPSTQTKCVRVLETYLPYTVGQLYVDENFKDQAAKSETLHMMTEAHVSFRMMLKALTWLDFKSTSPALLKLTNMINNAGYPDWIENDTLFIAYHETLNFTEFGNNWFYISQALTRWATGKNYLLLNESVDQTWFLGSPMTADNSESQALSQPWRRSWYQPWRNSVQVNAAILQEPLFRLDFPKAVNYGAAGTKIGIESTHGYDLQGIQFNANGTLQYQLSPESTTGFQNMSDCILKQYNDNFFAPNNNQCSDANINSMQYIADNAGIRQSYFAYQRYVATYGEEPKLPGLEKYSMEQIFFISFSTMFCENIRPDSKQSIQQCDTNDSLEFRLIGALQNFEGFGEAFNCQQGVDYMYPNDDQKCFVWSNPPGLSSPSEGFMEASDFYLQAVDFNVDPCENFYDFACGAWIESNPIPPYFSEYYLYDMLQETVINDLADLFYDIPPGATSVHGSLIPIAIQKANWAFYMCANSAESEVANNKPLLGLLAQFGGWPVITPDWNSSNCKTCETGATVGMIDAFYGVSTLVTPIVDADWVKQDNYILYIDQATLSLPRDVYQNIKLQNILDSAKNYSLQVAFILAGDNGLNINDPNTAISIKNQISEIYDFESKIANLTFADEDRRNSTQQYNPMTIRECNDRWPFMNWTDYIFNLIPSLCSSECLSSGDFDKYAANISVVIMQPKFLDYVNAEFSIIPAENKTRNFMNYLLWRLTMSMTQFLDTRVRSANFEFLKVKNDIRDLPPSFYDCVNTLINTMSYAVGRLFVDHFFSNDTLTVAINVASQVQAAFGEILNNLSWLDQQSIQTATKKLVNIVNNIGFPEWITNDFQLNEYYQELEFFPTEKTWFETYLRLIKWWRNKYLTMTGNPVDRKDFQYSPAWVNAWYSPAYNSLTYPASSLQPPFFGYNFPMAVNFGVTGSFMGHETGHAFDDQGIQFDENAKLNFWMSPNSYESFLNMTTCLADEYSAICPPDEPLCLRGKAKQGENMADNAGIRMAFEAYKTWTSKNGQELLLPGLEKFSMNQVFFLAFTSLTCGQGPPALIEMEILTNPHTPGRYRTLNTLKNMPEFGIAYKCKQGIDQMYPDTDKTCPIWRN